MGLSLLTSLLMGVALVISLAMLWDHVKGGGLPGCGDGSGCGAVTSSRWTHIGPVPVAGMGAGMYLVMLVLWVGWGPSAAHFLAAMALAAIGAAAWFTLVQLVVIRRICRYCMLLHLAGATAGGLVLWATSGLALPWVALTVVSAGLLGVLIGGQVLIAPRTYRVSVLGESVPAKPGAREEEASEPEHAPEQPVRTSVSLAHGRVVASVGDWPILGRPDAKHLLMYLFDYTCPDCRHVHGLIVEVLRQYPQDVAFLAVPVPLEPNCNPLVSRRLPENENACMYARYALAVWMAKPQAWAEYDARMFSQERPPSVSEARAWAEELAGATALGAVLGTPLVEAKLGAVGAIYEGAGGGKIPRILLRQAVVWGRVPTAKDLAHVLQSHMLLVRREQMHTARI